MNMSNLLSQILNSQNPYKMIMGMMTPQQQQMANAFLQKPNREQALQDLMRQNNVSQAQVDNLKNMMK